MIFCRLSNLIITIVMIMLSRSLLGFRLASRGSMYRTSVYQLKSSVSSTTFTSSALRNNYEQLTSLLQEINNIVRSPGMAKVGFTRSFQVSKALAKVAIEFTKNREVYMDSKGQLSLPKSLRRIFEELGSTYIKLGQFIASSPTLFPPEYVTEFQACLDKSPSVPYSVIRKTIQDDLKRPISSVFGSIDPKPLATASIAQVHKAKLRDGTDVVIKVQKPGVDSMLQADLSFLLIATKILEFINPAISSFSLVNIVGDLRDSMLDELDFTKEASNLENFRTFLKVNNIVDATAPMHYPSASGKKVLTMEYLKGVPLVDLEGIKKYTSSPENTLVSALRTWATSVANNDVFHADVHAGNLLVLEDGRIGFIDFGIVGKLSTSFKQAMESLVNALLKDDFYGVALSLVELGATKSDVDINRFGSELEQVVKKISMLQPEILIEAMDNGSQVDIDARLTLDERETTQIVLDIVNVAERNGLKLPKEFGLIVKQALYFDRYQKLLAPTMDPLRDSRVRERLSQELMSDTPPSSQRGPVIDVEAIDPGRK